MFWAFSSEDLDFTNFSFDVLEIIQCVFIKRETMTELLASRMRRMHVFDSFPRRFLHSEYNAAGLPGEILKCSSV